MRVLFCLLAFAISGSSAFAMTTKDRVRMILWVKGIQEVSEVKAQKPKLHLPEEIERPLRKL